MTAAVPCALRVVLQHRRSRQVVRVTVSSTITSISSLVAGRGISGNLAVLYPVLVKNLIPNGYTSSRMKEAYLEASHTVFIQILRGYRCLPFNEMTQEVNDRLKIPFILHGQAVLKKTIPDRRHASGCLIYRYLLGQLLHCRTLAILIRT